ncbi:MAG: surface-adhesin E family protein [Betaproteobacteria bacterium]
MRKLLPLILLPVCITASADWVKVGDTRSLKFEKYIDPDTVKQSGPMAIMRQVWEIGNLLEPGNDGVSSVKTLAEYDCQNRKLRVLKEQWFDQPWAKGKELTPTQLNQSASDWGGITPNSVGAAIIDIVCPGGEDG